MELEITAILFRILPFLGVHGQLTDSSSIARYVFVPSYLNTNEADKRSGIGTGSLGVIVDVSANRSASMNSEGYKSTLSLYAHIQPQKLWECASCSHFDYFVSESM